MATPVELPKLGNTVEECIVSAWFVAPGAEVAEGDVLAEVETDKATFEVTAPVAGSVLALFPAEGDLVPVFTVIAVLGAPGEDAEPFRPGGQPPAAAPAVPAPAAPAAPEPVVPEAAVPGPPAAGEQPAPVATTPVADSGAPWSPRARRFAREHAMDTAGAPGSGPGGRVVEADARERWAAGPQLTPAARARAAAEGLVAPATGSGPAGLVRAEDLLAPAAAAAAPAATPVGIRVERMSTMRKKIAANLRESLGSTAQYTLHSSASAAGLLALRAKAKRDPATAGITINDLVCACTVAALREVPQLNSLLVDGQVHTYPDVDLGFAADTDRGLLVPVVRAAQNLSVLGLSARIKELAAQAQAGTLSPDDMTGGTFTVTNLGGLGIEHFTPVLNPPQVGILGVGAITLAAVRNAAGNIEFADRIQLSLTLDHQLVDGAPGARFLQVLRTAIERAEQTCSI